MINECRLFRAERFQLVLSKHSCGKGGRSPAMTHTENPNTHFALVNIKMCTLFFSPSFGQLACFRLKFKCSLKKAAFFNVQSKIVITMPNWKKAFFPSQAGGVMGIFPLSPYSRKSVSRKVFFYLSNRSNRMFGFFPP